MEYKFYKLVDQSYPLVYVQEFDSEEDAINKLQEFEEGNYLVYNLEIINPSLSHEKLIFNS